MAIPVLFSKPGTAVESTEGLPWQHAHQDSTTDQHGPLQAVHTNLGNGPYFYVVGQKRKEIDTETKQNDNFLVPRGLMK